MHVRFREWDRWEKNVCIYTAALQANCDRGIRDGAARRCGEQEVRCSRTSRDKRYSFTDKDNEAGRSVSTRTTKWSLNINHVFPCSNDNRRDR